MTERAGGDGAAMSVQRFSDVELDRARRRIRVAGELVHVEPQVYDVLVHLIDHRERVVPKEELLDEIWGSRFVSESALTSRIKSVRAAVGDSGREQHTIRTVHGTGYQFVADITAVDATETSTADAAPARSGHYARVSPPDNRFHGREDEVVEVVDLLREHRLVTLVGPGGTGKTRLAVEAVDHRGDEGAFLDLTTVRDGAAIGSALVEALGIQLGAEQDEIVAAATYLRGADLLLVVDNCEHVSDAAAAMVQRLLEEVPAVRVLATSRGRLGLREEQVLRVDPLPVIDEHTSVTVDEAVANPAIALFLERAQRTAHPVELDDSTLSDVIGLCAALDGLPLALELAAGRAGSFAVRDLLARLDQRLDLLDDDRADTHERHRSLRATLDWSFEDLDPSSQQLFVHLAVFPGGLPLDGIEWLAARLDLEGDPLRLIDRLVTASLVNRREHPSGSRYVQLETMRTFGRDCLETHGELDRARDLLVEWSLRLLVELRELDRRAPTREAEWNDRVRREMPNIRRCRQHLFVGRRHEELVQISMDLDDWAGLRDVSELWTWIDELLLLDDLDEQARLRVLAMAGQAAWRRGRFAETERLGHEVVAASGGDDWAVSRGHHCLGVARLFSGELAAAAESWLLADELGGNPIRGANAGLALGYHGQFDQARATAAAAHRRAVDAGLGSTIAWTAYCCGEIEATAGNVTAASAWLEQAVTRALEVGASFAYGVASVTRCALMVEQGRLDDAARAYRELIPHWLRSGSWTQLWTTMRNAVGLLEDTDPGLCVLVYDVADADPLASELDPGARARQDEDRARLVEVLGPEQVEAIALEAARLDRVELATRVGAALDEL